jgi:hypothetical protein
MDGRMKRQTKIKMKETYKKREKETSKKRNTNMRCQHYINPRHRVTLKDCVIQQASTGSHVKLYETGIPRLRAIGRFQHLLL